MQTPFGSLKKKRASKRRSTLASTIMLLASLSAGVLIWHLVSTYMFSSILFPGPLQVGTEAIAEIQSGSIFVDIGASMFRILAGFLIGSVIGIVLGLLVGFFPIVRSLFNPYLQFFRFIPPIAWVSPAMIWFGVGEESKIFIIIYGTVFTVSLSTALGVAGVHTNKIRAAQMFGATEWQIFRWVIVPAAVTPILQGMRIAMGIAFMTVIAAEMLAANAGIGYSILNARLWMATDKIFVGIFTLGILGYLTDKILEVAIHRFGRRFDSNAKR